MFSTLFRSLRIKKSDHRRTGRKRCRPALEVLEDRLVPATVNWIGGSGNWTDTSHWDTGHVPTAADDAVIGVANVTVTLNRSHSVKSVSLISADATLVIEGSSTGGNATLTETGGSSNAGTIELTSAGTAFNAALSITGSGSSLTNTGMITALAGAGGSRTLTINNGAFSNQGTLSVGAGVNLALNEAFSATFTNTGTILVASGQTLTISGSRFNASSGTLDGPGSVALNSLTLGSGTLQGSAPVYLTGDVLAAGETLTNTGLLITQATDTFDGTFSNASGATLRILGTSGAGLGNATLHATAAFSNAGTIELTSAGSVAFNAALSITGSGSSLTNTGTITALAGAGGSRTLTINNGAFSNQGTLSVGAGVNLALNEAFSATFTNTGTVGVAANQSLTISGGTFTNFSGGTLTGGTYDVAGTFQFSNAAITTDAANIILDGPSSQIVNQSNVNALANLATIAAGGSFTIQNGRNFTTAGTFRNFGALTVGNGSTFTDSGIFNQTGTLSILAGGTANLKDGSSSGAITNAGTVTITPNTAFIESGVYTQTGTLNVQGTLELDGGGSDSGNLANAGTLVIGGGSTFTESGTLSQTGTLNVQGASILRVSGDQQNAGAVSIDAGSTLAVGGTYLQTAGSTTLNGTLTAPTLFDLEGGTLSGTGTINGSLQNAASVLIGDATTTGTLTITGDYTQTSAGSLTVKLGGAGASDQLVIGGTATLDGTLNVLLLNDFMANVGDSYQILQFQSVVGDFATYNGLNLVGGNTLNPAYDAMDLYLVVS